jgi:hypothetical protein
VRRLRGLKAHMLAEPDQQISLTDPDSRSTATSGRGLGVVGYNVQVAVDTASLFALFAHGTNVLTRPRSIAEVEKYICCMHKPPPVRSTRGRDCDPQLRRTRHDRRREGASRSRLLNAQAAIPTSQSLSTAAASLYGGRQFPRNAPERERVVRAATLSWISLSTSVRSSL